MSFVYLLVSSDGATYVGATVDLDRRLRQHNKEIKGGAHATGTKVSKGETWERALHVKGFLTGKQLCNLNGDLNNYLENFLNKCIHWNDALKH